jgi:hypothetical protein
MINKYARHLEERDINPKTDSVWTIYDVPNTWQSKTEKKVVADGYHFESDGTAVKNEE